MNDTLIDFLIASPIIAAILYYSVRKELRLKRMTPEEREIKRIRKQIWLNKNSFGAFMYKIGLIILQICIIAHIAIQGTDMRKRFRRHKMYRNEVVITRSNLSHNNLLEIDLYNGLIHTIHIASRSRHVENLNIEVFSENGWKRTQDSKPFPDTTTLQRDGFWEQRFQLPPQTQSFRVGIPWMCEETGESGIAWSKRIDPPRKVSKGK